MDPSKPPGILIAQILLERAVFDHREDFLALPPNTPLGAPTITLTTTAGESPDKKRGIIKLRVQTRREQRPLYNLDVEMTALVEAEHGKENMPIEQYVRSSGPATLFPFIRQVVADLTSKGRFGPIWLSPVNFVAMEQNLRPVEGEEAIVAYRAVPEAHRVRVKTRRRSKK